MIAAISLFIIIFLTALVNRIATIALSHTGLSRESARFQARSALTGAGFTTSESEKVVSHPVRRKIILLLMLIGNAGIVTAVSSLILTFVVPRTAQSLFISLAILVVGVTFIWWAAQSEIVDRYLSRIIDRALSRYTSIDLRDYAAILHLSGDFQVTDLKVAAGDWIADQSLDDLHLPHEGILVLGIQRKDGTYLGTPGGKTKIKPDDVLTVYGRASSFKSLDMRKRGYDGDREHYRAVSEHERVREKEEGIDSGLE